MEVVVQLLAASGMIALMMALRVACSRAIFRFRMNHGFRAHDCDGSCSHHAIEQAADAERNHRI